MIKYETNIKLKKYWEKSTINEEDESDEEFNVIRVYPEISYQTYQGFGGAFTIASVINYNKLSKDKKKEFLNAYFSSEGLDYNWGRICISSNDFAISSYENNNYQYEKSYFIPFIKDVLAIKDLTFLASSWSPPSYMKDNNSLCNGGKLLKEYYEDYANYLIDYLKFYQKEKIKIKYLTMQNEPLASQSWESCVFNIVEQKDFIYNYLLPKLDDAYLFLWDHNKDNLYNVISELYQEHPKIKGVAYHWYTGVHQTNLKLTYEKFPNLWFMSSESCCGFSKYNEIEWVNDAEELLTNLISDLNSGMAIYLDWNLFLDYNGGPNHQKNYCKSPIILSKNEKDFIKSPIYYYFGHISKFMKNGSKINPVSLGDSSLKAVASTLNNLVTIVILNTSNENRNYTLIIKQKQIKDEIKAHSIITYQYNVNIF